MAEVVLLPFAYGAVGEEDEGALPRQAPDSVIGVDPGVHAFAGRELGARRPQLGAEHGGLRSECGEEVFVHCSRSTIQCAPVTPAALRDALAHVPSIPFAPQPTPVEPLPRSEEHTSELQSRQYLVC